MVNASRTARARQAAGAERAGVQVSEVTRTYTADVAIPTTTSVMPIRAATNIPIADAMTAVIRKARSPRARFADSITDTLSHLGHASWHLPQGITRKQLRQTSTVKAIAGATPATPAPTTFPPRTRPLTYAIAHVTVPSLAHAPTNQPVRRTRCVSRS